MNGQTDLVLERAGFAVSQHNGGKHWVLRGRGIRADFWPSSNKFRVFGKVFQANVEDFIADAAAGQYTRPRAPTAHCKKCGASIFWIKTQRDRWMPLSEDGGPHAGQCKRVQ